MTEEEYVRKYTENTVALHQVRAAAALGAIGGPEARRALEGALGRGDREDVQQAIRAALAQIRKR
jgi:HEAT repeat protein